MSVALAEGIVIGFGLYALLGLLVALAYLFGGAGRIDPAARTMPVRARVLILPGVIGLWPLMLVKLLRQRTPPVS